MNDEVEREAPNAQAIVQIGFLKSLRAPPAQGEGVLETARMWNKPEISEDSNATPVRPTRNTPHVRGRCNRIWSSPMKSANGARTRALRWPSASATHSPSSPVATLWYMTRKREFMLRDPERLVLRGVVDQSSAVAGPYGFIQRLWAQLFMDEARSAVPICEARAKKRQASRSGKRCRSTPRMRGPAPNVPRASL